MSLVEVYLSEGSQTALYSGSVESESHKGGEHSSLKSGDSRDCDSGIPLYKGAGACAEQNQEVPTRVVLL